MVEEYHPDVVLMDINMPTLNGIDATRIITSRFPDTKVVVLTMHTDESFSVSAYQAGACSFVAKGCGKDEILDAIMTCFLRP